MADKAELLGMLKADAQRLGLVLRDEGGDGFRGEIEAILMKWMLGQKKMVYRMSLRLSEGDRTAHYREVVKESSFGLVPPSLTVETTGVKGWERSGTHTETMPDGKGGTIDYGRARETLRQAVEAHGWRFDFEGGRMP